MSGNVAQYSLRYLKAYVKKFRKLNRRTVILHLNTKSFEAELFWQALNKEEGITIEKIDLFDSEGLDINVSTSSLQNTLTNIFSSFEICLDFKTKPTFGSTIILTPDFTLASLSMRSFIFLIAEIHSEHSVDVEVLKMKSRSADSIRNFMFVIG